MLPSESLDGKFLYYATSPNAEPEIWRVPVDGGEKLSAASPSRHMGKLAGSQREEFSSLAHHSAIKPF